MPVRAQTDDGWIRLHSEQGRSAEGVHVACYEGALGKSTGCGMCRPGVVVQVQAVRLEGWPDAMMLAWVVGPEGWVGVAEVVRWYGGVEVGVIVTQQVASG
jgi:hypothetical protein